MFLHRLSSSMLVLGFLAYGILSQADSVVSHLECSGGEVRSVIEEEDAHDLDPFLGCIQDTVILVSHIGEIDKPIATLALRCNGSKALSLPEDMEPSVQIQLSETELVCVLNLFLKGRYFTKSYDGSFEFGSFLFKIENGRHEKSFRTNRKESVQIFHGMVKCVESNIQARELIERNILRIRPEQ